MRRLYLQVYVAFVAILAVFAALTATLWHLRGPSPQDQQLLEGAAAVVAERLPSGSRAEQEASLRGLAAPLRLNLSLWSADGVSFTGRFYSTAGIDLEPKPVQRPSPPIWIGSWGSDAGLRRVARLGDGWLASAYNTMPDQFKIGLDKLRDQLKNIGKDPTSFPNALATMFMYITDDNARADRVLSETLAPMLNRPLEQLRERLLIGAPAVCAAKLAAYKAVGVQRVFIWPIRDELDQLTVFQKKVAPLVDA